MKLRRLWHEFWDFLSLISQGNRKVVPVMILGGLSGAALPFLGIFFSARILNQLIAAQYDACIRNVAILLLSQFLTGIVERACFQMVDGLRRGCERDIKQRMAAKAFELEYEEFEKQETMDAIRRANVSTLGSGGVEAQIYIASEIIRDVFAILYSMIFIVLLFLQVDNSNQSFFTSYWATLLLLAIYAVIFCFSGKIGEKTNLIFSEMSRKNDHNNSLANYLTELIVDEKNAKDVRVFQMQDTLDEKAKEIAKKNLHIYLQAGERGGKRLGVISFTGQIAAGLSYLFVGAKAVYGVIGIGDVLLYAGAINQAVANIVKLISMIYDFSYRAEYLKTYEEFIHRPSMSYDGTLPIEKRDDGNYEFEFHDVSFSYPGSEEEVISHISMKLKVGEKVAVVGRNGAGKTTLVKLLCRLYEPTGGVITLNGIDIRKYNYKEYVKVFSVVFQDFGIFSLPLDENVAAGGAVEEAEAWEVLDKVNLRKRVEKMDRGIHSQLYNNNGEGIDISGGEAQRLAIARALYKGSPFVILDEPTAALDPIAEAEIYEDFNHLVGNKTAIYISHRMSSCKFCDHIVVLDGGKIAEMGTHEELLQRGGIYTDLYETQAQYYA